MKTRRPRKTTLIAIPSYLAQLQALAQSLPPTWGYVNGKPDTRPLPDGIPLEIPESMKLPKELRGAV